MDNLLFEENLQDEEDFDEDDDDESSQRKRRKRHRITDDQRFILEESFLVNNALTSHLSSAMKQRLATQLDLPEYTVNNWFQNRKRKIRKAAKEQLISPEEVYDESAAPYIQHLSQKTAVSSSVTTNHISPSFTRIPNQILHEKEKFLPKIRNQPLNATQRMIMNNRLDIVNHSHFLPNMVSSPHPTYPINSTLNNNIHNSNGSNESNSSLTANTPTGSPPSLPSPSPPPSLTREPLNPLARHTAVSALDMLFLAATSPDISQTQKDLFKTNKSNNNVNSVLPAPRARPAGILSIGQSNIASPLTAGVENLINIIAPQNVRPRSTPVVPTTPFVGNQGTSTPGTLLDLSFSTTLTTPNLPNNNGVNGRVKMEANTNVVAPKLERSLSSSIIRQWDNTE